MQPEIIKRRYENPVMQNSMTEDFQTSNLYGPILDASTSNEIQKLEISKTVQCTYKPIKHGYARISSEGNLKLFIPTHFRNHQKFIDDLMSKGLQLLEHYNSKQKFLTKSSDTVFVFGEEMPILEVSPNPTKLSSVLKEILYDYAKPILDEYSQKIGIHYKDFKIRKTISKRGSCTHDQIISLNLDLVHLPTRLTRYVIIHESCHLKVKNHSSKFWDLVSQYCPNYKILRKELRSLIIK